MKRSKQILLVFVALSTIYVPAEVANVENVLENVGENVGENVPENRDEIFRNLMRPFRMEKLNLIWVKAQQVNKHGLHIFFAIFIYIQLQFKLFVKLFLATHGTKAAIFIYTNENTG